MQGDTAMLIGRPRQQGPGKLPGQLIWGVHCALGLAQDMDRNRWVKTLFEETLMRCGVVQPDERLVGLFQLGRCGAQRKLVVVQAWLCTCSLRIIAPPRKPGKMLPYQPMLGGYAMIPHLFYYQ